LQCIWTLPSEEVDFLSQGDDIKAGFAAQILRVERILEAKGGMRFAFPPYGPGEWNKSQGEGTIQG
jgi:hypothetical protein